MPALSSFRYQDNKNPPSSGPSGDSMSKSALHEFTDVLGKDKKNVVDFSSLFKDVVGNRPTETTAEGEVKPKKPGNVFVLSLKRKNWS
jgi:hypothetical protein